MPVMVFCITNHRINACVNFSVMGTQTQQSTAEGWVISINANTAMLKTRVTGM